MSSRSQDGYSMANWSSINWGQLAEESLSQELSDTIDGEIMKQLAPFIVISTLMNAYHKQINIDSDALPRLNESGEYCNSVPDFK